MEQKPRKPIAEEDWRTGPNQQDLVVFEIKKTNKNKKTKKTRSG